MGHVQLTLDTVLASAAFMFTAFWLEDALDRTVNPHLPQLINSDQEPIEWTEIRYPLAGGTTPEKLHAALAGIPSLRPENEKLWNWVEATADGKTAKPRRRPNDERMLVTLMDDGATILGSLELKDRVLVLSVNSAGRAKRGRTLIESALGKLVGTPAIAAKTTSELLAESSGDEGADRDDLLADLTSEERSAITQSVFHDHYLAVLDEPIPALGNVSPRKALRTKAGKSKVIDWLKSLENHHAHMAKNDPNKEYDCRWIWDELGLGNLRK